MNYFGAVSVGIGALVEWWCGLFRKKPSTTIPELHPPAAFPQANATAMAYSPLDPRPSFVTTGYIGSSMVGYGPAHPATNRNPRRRAQQDAIKRKRTQEDEDSLVNPVNPLSPFSPISPLYHSSYEPAPNTGHDFVGFSGGDSGGAGGGADFGSSGTD